MADWLELPKRRLDRARLHIRDLQASATTLREKHPHSSSSFLEPERRCQAFQIKVNHPVPPETGLIVGDCIHALRAALDNMIWILGQHYGEPTDSRWAFPIWDNPSRFDAAIEKMRRLPDEARRLITAFQPFTRAPTDPHGDLMWVLDRLWNDDKHCSPLIVWGMPEHAIWEIRVEHRFIERADDYIVPIICEGPIEDGAIIAKVFFLPGFIPPTEKTEINVKGVFLIDFALDLYGAGRGGNLATMLNSFLNLIEHEIFPQFQPLVNA